MTIGSSQPTNNPPPPPVNPPPPPPPPPPPSGGKVANFIGADSGPTGAHGQSVSDIQSADSTIGPDRLVKYFYSGSLPGTWVGSVPEAITKAIPGTAIIVCWNSLMAQSALEQFCSSIPAGQIVGFSWQSEQEGAYSGASGAARFIQGWNNQVDSIRKVGNNNLLAIPTSEVYQYAAGVNSVAQAGAYLPDASHVDVYGVDVYYHEKGGGGAWPSNGLANYNRFQTWLSLVEKKSPGAKICLAEYGIDSCLESTNPGIRANRLKQDVAYLRANLKDRVWGWCYWWRNMSATDCAHMYKFTDTETVGTWKKIANGSL